MPVTSDGPVILAAFANDRSDQTRFLRNLSEEAKRIQSVLSPAQSLCPLVLLPSATLDEILSAFQTYRDRIVVFHYAGHANGFQLLLESSTGGVHRVGAKGLASFLGQQQGLQLVFLNGCSTERQAEDLLNAGVGCVIATTQAIDDGVATDFSARFYKGIVTGAPLQSAYSEAVGSAQAASGGSIDRLLVPVDGQEEVAHDAGRWPWLLKFKPGAERVAQWSLPEAAGDPLFGLPPVPQRDLPESPYRHLYRFEAEHAEVFFGRGHEIRELYQRVTASDAAPVVLFYGPSGVGKSSLLDAGLIPRLAGKNEVRYIRRDPALGLGETLRSAFPKEVQQISRRDAWIAAEKQLGRPLVIVLDQVEEVFTKPHASQPHELVEFAQLLRRIFSAPDHRPQGKLILGFRKEWFAEIDELLADAQVPRSRIFLERLSRDGVIEAITGPVDDLRLASQYQLKIEDGLPEVIADDLLADPDTPVAPTLQILLTRMWSEAIRRNREQPTFDTELYQSLHRNGILLDDFLRQQTDQIRVQLPRAVDSGFLLDLLEFHTTAIGTSAEHSLSVLEAIYAEQAKSGMLSQTLALCEELYLLTFSGTVGVSTLGSSGPLSPAIDHASGKDLNAGERASVRGPAAPVQPPHSGPLPPSHFHRELKVARGGEGAETARSSRLLHDTLAPLIRARHEESDLPGQRSRRILDNRMVDWMAGQTGIPLDSKDLKEVEAALEGTRSWSADEQRLVQASREERAAKRRWRRIFKGLGVAAVVVIAVAGGVAFWQRGEAIAQKKVADSKTELAKQETAKAQLAQADADKQAASARRELARSERTQAVSARDQDHEFVKAAHHFASAAVAAAKDDPQQAERLRFAAGKAISGLTLAATMDTTNMTHEAWILDDESICAATGGISNPAIMLFRQSKSGEGIAYGHTLEMTEDFEKCYISPTAQRLVLVGESTVTQEHFEGGAPPPPFASQVRSQVSPDARHVVTWGQSGATVHDLESGRTIPLVANVSVDLAMISDSGQRALTWIDGQVPILWSPGATPDAAWTSAPLDALGPRISDKNLHSQFLSGTADLMLWILEQQPGASPAESQPFAKAFYINGKSGRPLEIQCRVDDMEYHLGRYGWTYSRVRNPVKESSEPTFMFCLWDSDAERIWTWRSSQASHDVFGIAPTSVYCPGPIDGVAISEDSQLAVWTRGEAPVLSLGTLKQFASSDPSPVMTLSHSQRIQEAKFSSEGSKLLVWTADNVPLGYQPTGAGANPAGTVRVWDTATGLPITAPLKYPKALRGAKWGHEDQGFLVWGEDLRVQHWQIQTPSSLHTSVPKPASEPARFEEIKSADNSRSAKVVRDRVVITDMGYRIVPRYRPVSGVRFTNNDQAILEWGGESGEAPGVGYALQWNYLTTQNLTAMFSHTQRVSYAELNSAGTLLLTTTTRSPQHATTAVTVHLWDLATNCELMEPLKIHDGYQVTFGPHDTVIEIPRYESSDRYDIAPVPAITSADPRWDVVLRTGTYLNRAGELIFLTNGEFLKLKDLLKQPDSAQRPSFEKWVEEVEKAKYEIRIDTA